MTFTPIQETALTLLALNNGEGWPEGINCVFLPGGLLVERLYNYRTGQWSVNVWTDASKILGNWYMTCHIGRMGEVVRLHDIASAIFSMTNLRFLTKMEHLNHLRACLKDILSGTVDPNLKLDGLMLVSRPNIEQNNLVDDVFPTLLAYESGGKGKISEYAVDFLSPGALGHLPVTVDNKWELKRWPVRQKKYSRRNIVTAYKAFTLGDIVTGLFYELTWHGPLNGSKEMAARIKAKEGK